MAMKQSAEFYLFYYKTEFCPFRYVVDHKFDCPYAHSENELRRDPSLFYYYPWLCPEWEENWTLPYWRRC